VLAVLATVVLVLGVDALGIASDVALLAIDPTATPLSVVALSDRVPASKSEFVTPKRSRRKSRTQGK